jgi:hypothetical protein
MKRDFLKRLRAANAKVERLKSELLATLTDMHCANAALEETLIEAPRRLKEIERERLN